MIDSDIAPFLSTANRLADAAAAITASYFRNISSIEGKADSSPVTIADREAEAAMRAIISKQYPSHGIIGEEHGSTQTDAEYIWVLDPIDGTKNFMTGQPLFTTLIALTYRGEAILSIVDQPITKERWVATADGTTLNNNSVNTSKTTGLSSARLSTTSPYLFDSPAKKAGFEALRTACGYDLYGSDAYGYAMLASGHVDLVVESGLKAHDIMALIPLITNAAGYIRDWNGEPITLNPSDLSQTYDVIAASNSTLAQAAQSVLQAAA